MAFGIPNKADALYARQAGGFSADIDTIAARLGLAMTPIGHITSTPGLRLLEADGRVGSAGGFDHFA